MPNTKIPKSTSGPPPLSAIHKTACRDPLAVGVKVTVTPTRIGASGRARAEVSWSSCRPATRQGLWQLTTEIVCPPCPRPTRRFCASRNPVGSSPCSPCTSGQGSVYCKRKTAAHKYSAVSYCRNRESHGYPCLIARSDLAAGVKLLLDVASGVGMED